MVEYQARRLDALFGAVADPTRRSILARLAGSGARVTDLAQEYPVSLNAISKHVKTLERAGLVRRQVTGREHFLTLDASALAEAAAWIEQYRIFWEDRLASLDSFVTQQRKSKGRKRT